MTIDHTFLNEPRQTFGKDIASDAQVSPLGALMPIFVPLDKRSKKNVGHQVGNLAARAIKGKIFSRSELKKMGVEDDFFGRVRQELADRLGVDVEKVEFEFRIRS